MVRCSIAAPRVELDIARAPEAAAWCAGCARGIAFDELKIAAASYRKTHAFVIDKQPQQQLAHHVPHHMGFHVFFGLLDAGVIHAALNTSAASVVVDPAAEQDAFRNFPMQCKTLAQQSASPFGHSGRAPAAPYLIKPLHVASVATSAAYLQLCKPWSSRFNHNFCI